MQNLEEVQGKKIRFFRKIFKIANFHRALFAFLTIIRSGHRFFSTDCFLKICPIPTACNTRVKLEYWPFLVAQTVFEKIRGKNPQPQPTKKPHPRALWKFNCVLATGEIQNIKYKIHY